MCVLYSFFKWISKETPIYVFNKVIICRHHHLTYRPHSWEHAVTHRQTRKLLLVHECAAHKCVFMNANCNMVNQIKDPIFHLKCIRTIKYAQPVNRSFWKDLFNEIMLIMPVFCYTQLKLSFFFSEQLTPFH